MGMLRQLASSMCWPKLLDVSRAPDQPHSRFRHVYPILRIDVPFDQSHPSNTVSVVKVLMSQADAEGEVSRLNQLNGDKGCVYLYCTSRLVEESADSPTERDRPPQ